MKSPYNINWQAKDTEEVLMEVQNKKFSYKEAADLLGTSVAAIGFHIREFRKKHGLPTIRKKTSRNKPADIPFPVPSVEIDPEDVSPLIDAVQAFTAIIIQKVHEKTLAENKRLKTENARLAQENLTLRESVTHFEKQFAEGVFQKFDVGV